MCSHWIKTINLSCECTLCLSAEFFSSWVDEIMRDMMMMVGNGKIIREYLSLEGQRKVSPHQCQCLEIGTKVFQFRAKFQR